MMRKSILLGAAFCLALLGGTSGEALAKSVCYDFGTGGILRLDVKFHSRLVPRKEVKGTDDPVQWTYSAHGKFVNSEGTGVLPAQATITVAKGVGARMGVFIYSLGDFDCAAGTASATPDEWRCLPSPLVKIDPSDNPLCRAFPPVF